MSPTALTYRLPFAAVLAEVHILSGNFNSIPALLAALTVAGKDQRTHSGAWTYETTISPKMTLCMDLTSVNASQEVPEFNLPHSHFTWPFSETSKVKEESPTRLFHICLLFATRRYKQLCVKEKQRSWGRPSSRLMPVTPRLKTSVLDL